MATLTGALIAADARRYVGKGYVYGGNASAPGNWDCSSFVSYVLGHDLRLALPGGKWGDPGFPPHTHGPVVESYVNWRGATPVGSPQAGDLCCWAGLGPNGHIGIATSSTQMVSALNSHEGVKVTPIVGTGPAGAPLVYRRVTGVAGGAGLPPIPLPAGAAGGSSPVAALVVFAVLAGGALLLAGVVTAAGVGLATRKLAQL